MALQYASKELKNDKQIVLAAIKENEWALQFSSDELKTQINTINPDDPILALEILIAKEHFSSINPIQNRTKKSCKI